MPRHLPTDPAFRSLLLAVLCAACTPKATPPESPDTPDATQTPAVEPAVEPTLPGVDLGRANETPTNEPLIGSGLLNPLPTVSGLALVERTNGMRQPTQTVLGQFGAVCQEADCSDQSPALDDASAIRRDCGQIGCTEWYILGTGTSSPTIGSSDALLAELGTVDTPAEARLLAWANGFDVASMPVEKDGLFAIVARQDISDCPVQVDDVHLSVSPDGTISEIGRVENPTSVCAGRLAPVCHEPTCIPQTVGQWLAQAAAMEAESAVAFRVLAKELAGLNAPQTLIDACLAAAEDEDRHARDMRAHAERYGATVPPTPASPSGMRDALTIALDNAAEGLGRETWGTLLAFWQARHAPDAALRASFARIAGDEARHAEISRALHRWLLNQLTEAEQHQVHQTVVQTWAGVAASLSAIPSDVRAAVGLPGEPLILCDAARQHGLAA